MPTMHCRSSVLQAGLVGEYLLVVAMAVRPQGLARTLLPRSVVGLAGGTAVLLGTWYLANRWSVTTPRAVADGGRESANGHHIQSCCRTIEQCADGDLTRRLDADTEPTGLGAVAASFNDLMAQYQNTLRTADTYADEVAGSATQLTTATKTTKETCEGVGEIVRDIVTAFQDQHEQIEEVSAEIHEMHDAIERTSEIQTGLSRKAERMQRASDTGTASTEAAYTAMANVQSQTSELSEMIEGLDRKTNEIERIVELINSIADKTTSLALDASLEVVSDDGRTEDLGGVADEITSLAEETKAATGDIEMHLEDIQGQTDRVVCEMAAMEETADEGMATAEETLDALSLISETVEETVDGVEAISRSTTALTGSAEEIADSADHMARVSDETISRAERVEHIVEEVTLALGEIYVNTKNLEIETSYLVGILDWFDIDDEHN